MKRITTFFLIIGLVLGWADTAQSSDFQAGAKVLLIEPGAKQNGMGEAYSAIADDATAGYYNPAGLAFQSKNTRNIQFMHQNWLTGLQIDDMYYEYLGYSDYAEGWGNFAFNVVYFNMGEQNRTTEHSANIIGTFHSFEVYMAGSYGATIFDNLSLGITLKGIYSKLAEYGQGEEKGKGIGTSFALDFGAMYKTPIKGLTLAYTIHNMGPKISYIDVTQGDPLPINMIFGLAYIPIDTAFNKLTFVVDVDKPLARKQGTPFESLYKGWYDEDNEFEQIDYKLGSEYIYNNFMALRAGYSYDKDGDLKTPTFGVGIIYDKLNVDIAYYASRDNPMQDSMRFSIGYNF